MSWPRQLLAAVAFLAMAVIFSLESFGSKSDGQISTRFATYLKLAHLLQLLHGPWHRSLVTFVAVVAMVL
ncbi:hypothetical protein SLA2020_423400 [Shorea laevis]